MIRISISSLKANILSSYISLHWSVLTFCDLRVNFLKFHKRCLLHLKHHNIQLGQPQDKFLLHIHMKGIKLNFFNIDRTFSCQMPALYSVKYVFFCPYSWSNFVAVFSLLSKSKNYLFTFESWVGFYDKLKNFFPFNWKWNETIPNSSLNHSCLALLSQFLRSALWVLTSVDLLQASLSFKFEIYFEFKRERGL